jgi:transposase
MVLDNGSIHHSYATHSLCSSRECVTSFVLPKYGSQLNPIERFWKHLKSTTCTDKLFPDMDALLAYIEQVLLEQNDQLSDSRFMFFKNFP